MDFDDPLLSMSLALEDDSPRALTTGGNGNNWENGQKGVEPLPINNQRGYVNIVGRITALPADILPDPDDYLLALSEPKTSQKFNVPGTNGITRASQSQFPSNQLMEATFDQQWQPPSMNSSERSGGSNSSFARMQQQANPMMMAGGYNTQMQANMGFR